jgi:hypothetical protein
MPRERAPQAEHESEREPEHEPEDERDEPAAKKLPSVTAEDVEPATRVEQAERERPENTMADMRETLLDRFVEDHTPAVVAASICRDLKIEQDLSIFLEQVPTRADPWVRAEAAAGDVGAELEVSAPGCDMPPCGPAPVAKGRDPP